MFIQKTYGKIVGSVLLVYMFTRIHRMGPRSAIESEILSASFLLVAIRWPAKDVVGTGPDDLLEDANDAVGVVLSRALEVDELLQVANAAEKVEGELPGHSGNGDQNKQEQTGLHCFKLEKTRMIGRTCFILLAVWG